uniref:WD_REPEATS_REGION domain-containing protein n=1 Tax=Panagrellus redivivus TaxID=6233 RepID=A0A7E4V9K2_PANRE
MAATVPKTLTEPHVVIQNDWIHIFRCKEGGKFFLNTNEPGQKIKAQDLEVKEGRLAEDSGFQAEFLRNTLKLTHPNGQTRSFVAPTVEFGGIHKYAINTADISPTQNLAVSADYSGIIVVWDTVIGCAVRNLEGHVMDVNKTRFFPSGMVVLSCGLDMTVRVWDVSIGWNARTLNGHRAPVNDIGIIEEGSYVASCSKDGTLKIWNVGLGAVSREHVHDSPLKALSISPFNPQVVAVSSEAGKVYLYDNRSPENAIFESATGGSSANAVAIHSENEVFAATADGSIWEFDLRNVNNQIQVATQRGTANAMVSRAGLGVATGFSDGSIVAYGDLFSTDTATPLCDLTGADCESINDLALSEATLVSACRDKHVRKYRLDLI